MKHRACCNPKCKWNKAIAQEAVEVVVEFPNGEVGQIPFLAIGMSEDTLKTKFPDHTWSRPFTMTVGGIDIHDWLCASCFQAYLMIR